MLIIGDFNRYTKEDSANETEYNPKDLIKLEELRYIGLWKYYPNGSPNGIFWYHPMKLGSDWILSSFPQVGTTLKEVLSYQNSK